MDTKVTLTAHRGWRSKYPENTMLSFRKALELDIDGVEMDVHRITASSYVMTRHSKEPPT